MSRTMQANRDMDTAPQMDEPPRQVVVEQETNLSPAEITRAANLGCDIPAGAQGVLFNEMKFVLYEFTKNLSDPMLNKAEPILMPADVSEGTPKEAAAGNIPALAFSHLTDSKQAFEAKRCRFVAMPLKNTEAKGVVYDDETIKAMEGYDYNLAFDRSGNFVAIFLMRPGWTAAIKEGAVCHTCGKFPAHLSCTYCMTANFCSETCRFRGINLTSIHGRNICLRFMQTRIKMGVMKYLEHAAPAEPAAATSNEGTMASE